MRQKQGRQHLFSSANTRFLSALWVVYVARSAGCRGEGQFDTTDGTGNLEKTKEVKYNRLTDEGGRRRS